MEQRIRRRCLILLATLVILAGAAWYFTRARSQPEGDAVLAGLDVEIPAGKGASYGL